MLNFFIFVSFATLFSTTVNSSPVKVETTTTILTTIDPNTTSEAGYCVTGEVATRQIGEHTLYCPSYTPKCDNGEPIGVPAGTGCISPCEKWKDGLYYCVTGSQAEDWGWCARPEEHICPQKCKEGFAQGQVCPSGSLRDDSQDDASCSGPGTCDLINNAVDRATCCKPLPCDTFSTKSTCPFPGCVWSLDSCEEGCIQHVDKAPSDKDLASPTILTSTEMSLHDCEDTCATDLICSFMFYNTNTSECKTFDNHPDPSTLIHAEGRISAYCHSTRSPTMAPTLSCSGFSSKVDCPRDRCKWHEDSCENPVSSRSGNGEAAVPAATCPEEVSDHDSCFNYCFEACSATPGCGKWEKKAEHLQLILGASRHVKIEKNNKEEFHSGVGGKIKGDSCYCQFINGKPAPKLTNATSPCLMRKEGGSHDQVVIVSWMTLMLAWCTCCCIFSLGVGFFYNEPARSEKEDLMMDSRGGGNNWEYKAYE